MYLDVNMSGHGKKGSKRGQKGVEWTPFESLFETPLFLENPGILEQTRSDFGQKGVKKGSKTRI